MKAFVTAALLMFSIAAIADEASDASAARIAELEARIKTLEARVERLTALLDAATSTRRTAAPTRNGQTDKPVQIDAPPLVIAAPQETVRDEIRFQCMQRQTYEHAIGGAEPNFGSC